jgi:hypothetical protein
MSNRGLYSDDEDDIPLPSQQPLEVGFIENRVTDYRDTDGKLPAKFDVKKQKFVRKAETVTFRTNDVVFDLEPEQGQTSDLALVVANESFTRAIEQFKREKSRKTEIANFSLLDECHNWAEVVQVIRKSQENYKSEAGVQGKIRNVFRRIGDNAKSIQSFVGLLPDGSYKTLCGGLTLILTVGRPRTCT